MENFIQLKPKNTLKFGIRTADIVDDDGKVIEEGHFTGEYIEIDVEEIDLAFRLQDCQKLHNKNWQDFKAKETIINKRQDVKIKNSFMTKNQLDLYNAQREFYKKEEEVINLLLGENATKKILNGRSPYITMFQDINEYIEKVIMPKISEKAKSLNDGIKAKYNIQEKKEDNIL